jgi:RimJ/RimL family protein N-acetyltransferase
VFTDPLASEVATSPSLSTSLTLHVRPIRSGDAPLVAEIFARLNVASRYARFLTGKDRLTAAELRYFTEIDHHDHEALIAITWHGDPVGVARFVRYPDDPTTAEVAIEVVDDWQSRGVGSLLATRLSARAQHEGIRHVTALLSADNRRSRRLLARIGDVTHVHRDGATVSYRVDLPASARVLAQQADGLCREPAP